MKFNNWKLDDLIQYLTAMKSAPSDRLDYRCVPRVWGEIFVENGERINKEEKSNSRCCKTCYADDMGWDEIDCPCWNCKGDHSEWMPKND